MTSLHAGGQTIAKEINIHLWKHIFEIIVLLKTYLHELHHSWFKYDDCVCTLCVDMPWISRSVCTIKWPLSSNMAACGNALYAVKAQTSLAPLSRFRGSRVTTAHAHQCCIFQSYAKTVKLAMKLTMHEPTFMGSMTTDT